MSAKKSLKSQFDDLSIQETIILPYLIKVLELSAYEPTRFWTSFIKLVMPRKLGKLFWIDKNFLSTIPIYDDLLDIYNLKSRAGINKFYKHADILFDFLNNANTVGTLFSNSKKRLVIVDWEKIDKIKQLLGFYPPEDITENYMNKKGDFTYKGATTPLSPTTQVYKYINLLQKSKEVYLSEIYDKIGKKYKNKYDAAKTIRKNTKNKLCPAIMSKEEFDDIFIAEKSFHKLIKRVNTENS